MHRLSIGHVLWVLAGLCLGVAGSASAATTQLGMDIEATPGSSNFLVNAGDAIQLTCGPLAAAGGPQGSLPGAQQDLYNRCNEMITTYQPAGTNSYGYAPGNPGDSARLNAVRQFSGEETSSQGRFATDSTNKQFTNLGNRFDAIRRGARSSRSGVAMTFNDSEFNRSQGDMAPLYGGGASADESGADLGWAWFANVGIGFGDRQRTENEDGYDFDSYVATLGVDYALQNGVVIGMAVGYDTYSVDFDGNDPIATSPAGPVSGGDIDGDGYTVSTYATYATERFFVNGIVMYGANDYDMTRRIQLLPGPVPTGRPAAPGFELDRKLNSDTDSDQIAGQITGGTTLGTGATSVDLYVGIDYLTVDIDGFTESEQDLSPTPTPTPGLALTFSSQDVDSTQSLVGFTLRHVWNTGVGVLLPYLGGEWRHEFENDSRTVDYGYQNGIAQPNFRTPTDNVDTDFFIASVGLSTQFANNLFAFVQYDGTLGLEDTTASFVTIGIRGTF